MTLGRWIKFDVVFSLFLPSFLRFRLAQPFARVVYKKNKTFILIHLSEAMSHLAGDGKMPKTKRKATARKNVRIPKSIMDEIDRIVRGSEMYINRQQFIESALRKRIEESKLAGKIGDDFAARIKDKLLMHAIVNAVKEETMPANHLDLKQFEPDMRRYIEERAEREGKKITKEWLNELTEDLLKYHNELLEGLDVMTSRKSARRTDFSREPMS
jgi:hypothetical protein